MSDTRHIVFLLNDYIDGLLPPDEVRMVEGHLADCAECSADCARLSALVTDLKALPTSTAPPRDLWPEIKSRIEEQSTIGSATRTRTVRADDQPARRLIGRNDVAQGRTMWLIPVAAALFLVGIGLVWVVSRPAAPGWDVVALAGQPSINRSDLGGRSKLRVGQWLETDGASRARVDVGEIGTVDVAPDTRIQLLGAGGSDHRLVLEEGSIEAFIWAPPRLFFVETPSAQAIDLGCAYTLTVDSLGTSLLHVTSGFVELELHGRRSLVPAGTMCTARAGIGPGTAFSEEASPALREALTRYDFERGGSDALNNALAAVGPGDVITVWQLLLGADSSDVGRVYDRLVEFVEPPPGTTRDGILQRDESTIQSWQIHLGFDVLDAF